MSSVTTPDVPADVQDEPWWLPPCRDAIKAMGATMCDEVHCTEAEQQNHNICYCNYPWLDGCKKLGHGDPSCCSYDATSPVYVSGPNPCYCCCGCFANETNVATTSATETKEIAEFVVGDPVWVAMDAGLNEWAEVPVAFSAGTGRTAGVNSLIRIRYGSTGRPEIVYANRDQLFMLVDHKLKRAVKLVPGVDEIIRPDGSGAPVLDMASGKYHKGVHHISTTTDPGKGVAGHLIIANGLVGGDYALQLQHLELTDPGVLVEGHAELPDFGTEEYAARYTQLTADAHGAAAEGRDATEVTPGFVPFGAAEPVREDARSFVTQQQAEDIQKNGKAHPAYTGSATAMLDYLFSLFSGFNPSVMFRVDHGNELPNAYAFREFDVPFVVINGGLARQDGLSLEGLALIIGQALGHLYGGEPLNDEGYSCTGVADFAATAAMLPEAFFGARSWPIVQAGLKQVRDLFDLIDIAHRDGRPGDTCTYISIECRLSAMEAGANSAPLPECAGGAPTATLEVVGAEPLPAGEGPGVAVTFNEAVDPETVTVAAFDFEPPEPATKATLDPGGRIVAIAAALKAGRKYKVTAITVKSASGRGIVEGAASATFTMPKADGEGGTGGYGS
jgi:hypothetical protein